MINLRVVRSCVLAAAMLMMSACGGGADERPTRTPLPSETTSMPPVTSQPDNRPPGNKPPADQPPPGTTQRGTSTAVARPADACAAQPIVGELDNLDEYLRGAKATVRECDGKWAVIVWDVPGDSQRIIRRAANRWTTYVQFPHNVCWAKASADGVPAQLRKYFTC